MSSSTSKTETVWYENTREGTFHEVEKGSDTDRRMQRDTYPDPEDEDTVLRTYERASKARATANASEQPGYVRTGAVEATEQTPASPVSAVKPSTPQTPTADTATGPLVGEPGADAQAKAEVELGGAAPAGVKPSATAAKRTASQAAADKAAGK